MSINVRSALDLLTGSGCNLRKDGVSCFRRFIERREKKKRNREREEKKCKAQTRSEVSPHDRQKDK